MICNNTHERLTVKQVFHIQEINNALKLKSAK